MFLMVIYCRQGVMTLKKINGDQFKKLLKDYGIQNQMLSEYLECDRSTIISRKKSGLHNFSDSQCEKLDDLFTCGSDYYFKDFIRLNYENKIDITKLMIEHTLESLRLSRKIKEYQKHLITYRYMKDFSNPKVILPQNRFKHLELIEKLMESTGNVEYIDRELNKRYDYFMTSNKFLTGIMSIQLGYILSVQVKYRDKYNKTDPNKLIKFSINRVWINELPIENLGTYEKKVGISDDNYTGVSAMLNPEMTECYNELKAISNTETRFDDFIDKLANFNSQARKHIVMYLDEEDDEFDYMMSNLDARRRDKLSKINIYKLNNMFGRRGNTYLTIDEALQLYNIKYDGDRLLLDPLYRNVAINALINKLCFKYGGGEEERMKSRMNSSIHISGKDKDGNPFSKYTTMIKSISENMERQNEELDKRLEETKSDTERNRLLIRKKRMKQFLDESPFDIPSQEERDLNIEKRRKIKKGGEIKNG